MIIISEYRGNVLVADSGKFMFLKGYELRKKLDRLGDTMVKLAQDGVSDEFRARVILNQDCKISKKCRSPLVSIMNIDNRSSLYMTRLNGAEIGKVVSLKAKVVDSYDEVLEVVLFYFVDKDFVVCCRKENIEGFYTLFLSRIDYKVFGLCVEYNEEGSSWWRYAYMVRDKGMFLLRKGSGSSYFLDSVVRYLVDNRIVRVPCMGYNSRGFVSRARVGKDYLSFYNGSLDEAWDSMLEDRKSFFGSSRALVECRNLVYRVTDTKSGKYIEIDCNGGI